jgi:hypothetical protein
MLVPKECLRCTRRAIEEEKNWVLGLLTFIQVPDEISEEPLLVLVWLWGEMDFEHKILDFRCVLEAMILSY